MLADDIDPRDVGYSSEDFSREDPVQAKRSNNYIYKECGGFKNFCEMYGLRYWNDDDVYEAHGIASAMRRNDEEDAREARELARREREGSRNPNPNLVSAPAYGPPVAAHGRPCHTEHSTGYTPFSVAATQAYMPSYPAVPASPASVVPSPQPRYAKHIDNGYVYGI